MVKQIRLSFNDTIAQTKLSAQLPDLSSAFLQRNFIHTLDTNPQPFD